MVVWKQPDTALGSPRQPALFLDRDGVVVVDRHYLADPDKVELVPGATAAMLRAKEAGFLLIGVSNQSGLGRGKFGFADLAAVMTRLDVLLEAAGVPFDAFHYCPHAPGEGCRCRKPALGMRDDAAVRLTWDSELSWMVGDKEADVAFGRAAGLGSVLVRTGHGRTEEPAVQSSWAADPRVRVADDLPAAVDLILSLSGNSQP